MSDYDQEEQEIIDAYDADGLKRSTDADEIGERHARYADAMLRKDARINIRLSTKDLRALQKRAIAEGMPYQTLVASVLHKFVEGRLHEDR
ncbi:MAG: antitoxin [Spirochaetaceae bacterium]|nr:MAG: antitoxin [Spirochaetaceae bacterium]